MLWPFWVVCSMLIAAAGIKASRRMKMMFSDFNRVATAKPTLFSVSSLKKKNQRRERVKSYSWELSLRLKTRICTTATKEGFAENRVRRRRKRSLQKTKFNELLRFPLILVIIAPLKCTSLPLTIPPGSTGGSFNPVRLISGSNIFLFDCVCVFLFVQLFIS
ncbi:hypothetical protein NE237_022001 [Protea cynaroides]|uniref:Uncharacterized protein n=1 Tax=Protea cynaroides TaxID=273540 RepID=A0A9Q0H8U3_9MAGN|nr:hypothetical protein NE237_022001 [Protea cynaroides]